MAWGWLVTTLPLLLASCEVKEWRQCHPMASHNAGCVALWFHGCATVLTTDLPDATNACTSCSLSARSANSTMGDSARTAMSCSIGRSFGQLDSMGQWASRSGHEVFGFDAKEAAHAQRRSDHAGRGVLGLQRGKGQGLLGQGSRALRGSKCDSSWMLARTCPSGRSSAPL